ncbi:hypothetical protein HYPSUDRAFT_71604 [Hypholoma sublateritium FD-334 SS-4]|uniref:DUF3533 domain-containing protein n=1 Tax=Hypholoma sublateritium (strain FD-334 SS-4) TaxID=945553 RepID=A0A0D2P6Q5_HYPSF|nr:hypothetical protein HYPSUDRAFT_71604 [Hypholoma sublateritium FD-334 SS-4]
MLFGSDSTSRSNTLHDSRSAATTLRTADPPTPVHTLSKGTVKLANYGQISERSTQASVPTSPLFTKRFRARGDPEVSRARMIYLKTYVSGLSLVIVTIFVVFSIYWGALWKVPAHPLKGWIVDFDGADVGRTISEGLLREPAIYIKWDSFPGSQFANGIPEVIEAVKQDQTWIVVVINENATSDLQIATASPTALYNGSDAITVYAAEARNENAYRDFIRPLVQTALDKLTLQIAIQLASQLSSSSDLASLLSISPQTVVSPISYTIVNLIPFDQPVASAVVFVGLIYLLILSFFIVMIAHGAREASGIDKILRLRSLIIVRLVSSMFGYFFLSLFYALLNLAFKIDLTRRYGNWGFIIFWMLNWIGMLSVGLALESLITLLTPKFIPFFMILWIIVNVSVCVFPITVLPRIYHYGYAVPFYNISNSIRSIAFGTRNTLGLNFGVLFAWVVISCVTLPLVQWYVRRGQRRAIENSEGPSLLEKR